MNPSTLRRIIQLIMVGIFAILCIIVVRITKPDAHHLPELFLPYHSADISHGWNLVLVNENHYIPKHYTCDLTTMQNGENVDSRIYPDLRSMLDAASSAGLQLYVRSGHRTYEQQRDLFENKVEEYRQQGYSRYRAVQETKKWVAAPGTSEHQLGLGIDLYANEKTCSVEDGYDWLIGNSYKYGFVHRYPPEKRNVTGVYDEPWHYRYVGHKAAKEMFTRRICLEEYVQQLNE